MNEPIDANELAYHYFSKPAQPSEELVARLTKEFGDEFFLPIREASVHITSDTAIPELRDAVTAIDAALNVISRTLDLMENTDELPNDQRAPVRCRP